MLQPESGARTCTGIPFKVPSMAKRSLGKRSISSRVESVVCWLAVRRVWVRCSEYISVVLSYEVYGISKAARFMAALESGHSIRSVADSAVVLKHVVLCFLGLLTGGSGSNG